MNPSIQGALLAMLATAFFATGAAFAKTAAVEFHVLQILFFRQLVVFASALPVVARHFPQSLRTLQPGLHLVRLAGAFVALSAGIWAVSVLPLTTAVTLGFAKVFFVALLASWLLAEAGSRIRWLAIMVGFLGVLIVTRPGLSGFSQWQVVIPVAGAFGAAVAQVCVRKLAQTESTASLLTFQAVFIGILSGVPLLWLWVTPDQTGLLMLLLIGVLATAGQWLAVRALRLSEAGVVSSLQYLQLVFAAALGYLFLDELPDRATLTGAIVIVISALVLLRHEATGGSKPAFTRRRSPD